jgi:hypothetical protein
MHIIWKRPDGFQNAQPEDFRRVALSNGAHLWIHRLEKDWYPFQVNGDWEGQQQTARLNRLINLLGSDQQDWRNFLEHCNDDDLKEESLPAAAAHLMAWVDEIKTAVKGETWEVHIMQCAFEDVRQRLASFLAAPTP